MTQGNEPFSHIVIVGSSSGGVSALSRLVEHIPESITAPIIIAQHLDPERASSLSSILSRHTTLPVRIVENRSTLDPGVIHVISSNQQVDFVDREVRALTGGDDRPRPSIDRLLESAADSFGDQLISVILTGTGSDGTSGARRVKAMDGTVIIQNPRTAEYPGMPRSLALSTVDFVCELEEIGPLLEQLITNPDAIDRSIAEDYSVDEFLLEFELESKIDFSQYKRPTILRRLQRRMVATGAADLREYADYLRDHPEEHHALIHSFLIKVTEFFRDPELFEELQQEILPRLIEHGRMLGKRLRIWSAGCATGEEAYSLAIAISEVLGEELSQFSVRIFATDLDDAAITFARRGVYSAAALSAVPEEIVHKYFELVDGEYEISKQLRSMLIFGQHDLGQRSPFPRIDLILCRNVLIYFAGELQRRALQLFAFSLRSGGYLVLGKSESPGALAEHFTTHNSKLRIYLRDGDSIVIPKISSDTIVPLLPKQNEQTTGTPMANHRSFKIEQHDRPEQFLAELPVGLLAVDQNYDIRTINSTARRLLGIHGSAVGEDLLHVIRTVPLETVRNGIDQAFRTGGRVNVEGEWPVETVDGENLHVEILCYSVATNRSQPGTVLVVIMLTDVTAKVRERQQLDQEHEGTRTTNEQLRARVNQLLRNNEQLLNANQELAALNEELRDSNDQLLVSNEEAQAAAEEIETLNEELQASNEELETLTEELQSTVEELYATNEDMQTRTVELQDMTVSLEEQRSVSDSERAQLGAILASMGDAVLVVDSTGNVLLMNDACRATFGEDLSGLVPQTETGEPVPADKAPHRVAMRGEPFSMQFTILDGDGNRCWFEANGRAIQGDSKAADAVVVIRDITDRSLRKLQEEFMSIASHELRTPLTALRGYLEMLRSHLNIEDDRSQRYVSIALTMATRLGNLVSDLLEVGRLHSGKFTLEKEKVSLTELVRETVEFAQPMTTTHTISLNVPEDEVLISIDVVRFQQVLLNLLTNAIAYSPGQDRIDVVLENTGDEVTMHVSDFGIGIEPVARAQIFSRFYQAAGGARSPHRGLGLGLYIAQEVVTAHQGEIHVESEPGAGSTFTVRLPINPAADDSETNEDPAA